MEDIQNKALNVNVIGPNEIKAFEIGTNTIGPNAIGPNSIDKNTSENLTFENFILNKNGNIIGVKNTTPKKKNESVMGYF
jgi:hypothetical protein